MIELKRICAAVVVAGSLLVGTFGCAEKPPAKSEIKVTTPGGATVTIERPVNTDGQNHPPANP